MNNPKIIGLSAIWNGRAVPFATKGYAFSTRRFLKIELRHKWNHWFPIGFILG
jgi:hypothetical protein